MGGAGPWTEAKGGRDSLTLSLTIKLVVYFPSTQASRDLVLWQKRQHKEGEGPLPNQFLLFIPYFSPGPKPFLCGLQLCLEGEAPI